MLRLPAGSHATTLTTPSRGIFGIASVPGPVATRVTVRAPKRSFSSAGSLTKTRSG
jgi:hypothetical protein